MQTHGCRKPSKPSNALDVTPQPRWPAPWPEPHNDAAVKIATPPALSPSPWVPGSLRRNRGMRRPGEESGSLGIAGAMESEQPRCFCQWDSHGCGVWKPIPLLKAPDEALVPGASAPGREEGREPGEAWHPAPKDEMHIASLQAQGLVSSRCSVVPSRPGSQQVLNSSSKAWYPAVLNE